VRLRQRTGGAQQLRGPHAAQAVAVDRLSEEEQRREATDIGVRQRFGGGGGGGAACECLIRGQQARAVISVRQRGGAGGAGAAAVAILSGAEMPEMH
jgi:hypothetical protein